MSTYLIYIGLAMLRIAPASNQYVQEDRRKEKKTGCGDQGLRECAQKSKNRFRSAWWFGLRPRAQRVCAEGWVEKYSLTKTSLLHPCDHLDDHLRVQHMH